MCQQGRVCLGELNDGRTTEDREMVSWLLRDQTLRYCNPLTAIRREIAQSVGRRRRAGRAGS